MTTERVREKGRIDDGAAFFLGYVQGTELWEAALLSTAIVDYVAADAPVR